MSTNYRWRLPDIQREVGLPTGAVYRLGIDESDPTIHLGLRTAGGFVWAQDPEAAKAACLARPDEALIENDSGAPITCREFLEIVGGLKERSDWVGTRFG